MEAIKLYCQWNQSDEEKKEKEKESTGNEKEKKKIKQTIEKERIERKERVCMCVIRENRRII